MLQTLGTKASGILLNFQKKKLSPMLAFPFLPLLSHLPSNPAWCTAHTEFCPGILGRAAWLCGSTENWLTILGGHLCLTYPTCGMANPTETSGQLSRGKMVASKKGAGQHGPLPINPGFNILTPMGDLTQRDVLRGAGRRGGEGRGCQGAPEPPILPGSRGLSALGGSVGTRSRRCFVLVHLSELLMHS